MRNEVRIFYYFVGYEYVVEFVGVYEGSKYVYIVMEFLFGGELFDCIVEKGKYSEKDVFETVRIIVEIV